MNVYWTEIKAICPKEGILKTYGGENISAISIKDAQDWCDNNGMGYCKVMGLLDSEIPCKKGTLEPDYENEINYKQQRLN